MEQQTNIICIAMASIFSTGINVKNLHYILFVSGGKSFIRTIQSIGRGLRLHKSKNKLVLLDFYDNMKYSSDHIEFRKEFYDDQQLDWKETEIFL
jgi:superfamily II DNA or RNA helicase